MSAAAADDSSYEYVEYEVEVDDERSVEGAAGETEKTPFMDEEKVRKWTSRGRKGLEASTSFLLNQYRNAKHLSETHPKKVIVVLMAAKLLILISSIWETIINILALDLAQILVNVVLSVYVVLSLLIDVNIMFPSLPGLSWLSEVAQEWTRFLYHRLGRGAFHLTIVVLAISPGIFTSSIIELIGIVPLVVFAGIDVARGGMAVWRTNKTLRELALKLRADIEEGSDQILSRLGMPSTTGDIEALETNIASGVRFAAKHFGPEVTADQVAEVCKKFNIPLEKKDLAVIFEEEAKDGKIKTADLKKHVWTEFTNSPPQDVSF